MRRGAVLSLERKLQIVEDVCRALAAAHRADIVHRDIKPANILVGHDGTVKVVDFGIARTPDSALTQLGMLVGTLEYMAPEQFGDDGVDARTDIYAVGVLLYELIAQKRPFAGDLQATVAARVQQRSPMSLIGRVSRHRRRHRRHRRDRAGARSRATLSGRRIASRRVGRSPPAAERGRQRDPGEPAGAHGHAACERRAPRSCLSVARNSRSRRPRIGGRGRLCRWHRSNGGSRCHFRAAICAASGAAGARGGSSAGRAGRRASAATRSNHKFRRADHPESRRPSESRW